MRQVLTLALLIAAFALAPRPAAAGAAVGCTEAQFAAAVDKAGAALRAYNKDAQPRLKEKLERLAASKGWPRNEAEERGLDYLMDGRVSEFDADANEQLSAIDRLGRVEDGKIPDCTNLKAIDDAAAALLAIMARKSAYLIEKIEREVNPSATAATSPKPAESASRPAEPNRKAANEPQKEAKATSQEFAPPAPQPQFETTIIPSDSFVVNEQGYSIEEIREITRGFFGTISTELAAVLEHAFAQSGRPTAYVLGSEGGGAFLAGLRYGKGTLYLRSGGSQPIYWHGPSLGSDIGADGSRTLYLIYRLKDPAELYRRFGGIDGSAYFVGGVGLTFLKGGDVIMAPIRSGIGFRLGANIGYVRFTPKPTWNPF